MTDDQLTLHVQGLAHSMHDIEICASRHEDKKHLYNSKYRNSLQLVRLTVFINALSTAGASRHSGWRSCGNGAIAEEEKKTQLDVFGE
jgi:hypothetical protein